MQDRQPPEEAARVLVVEDHPETNAFIAQALAARYRVTTAFDGQEGLDQAMREPPPDLVVVDMIMPVMSGEAMIERLGREPGLVGIPVLVLTGPGDGALQARVLRKGAHGFLQKPFSEEVLLGSVARLLADERRSRSLVHRSEERLRAILETAKDAIIVTDEARRIVLFNGAAQRMFGYEAADVLGENLQLLLRAECLANCQAPDANAAVAGMHWHAVTCETGHAVRADGEEFPAECSMSQLQSDGNFCTVILRDITRRVRDRQALVDAHEELQRVTQGFQQELIAAVEARQAGIARDLHDSIGASLAGISLLLAGVRTLASTPPRAAAALDKAQEQIAATAEAVRRISRGLMPAGTDGAGLVQALEQFASDLEDNGVHCTLRARGRFGILDASAATHIFRIVQEAATNAIRHGDAAALRIVLAEARGHWRVTVADDGIGCDFQQLPGGHPGLGLRSMQARARAMQARIEFAGAMGGGCRVRLTWTDATAARPADRNAPELAARQLRGRIAS